jgi:transcriptional regulator with XRE-family HTH domain
MPAKASPANVALGEAIRAEREAAGHTQESFGALVGLHWQRYGSIERAEHNSRVDTLVKVATGLHLSLSELFGRAGL